MDWNALSGDALERALNPRVAVPDAETYLAAYAARAAEARARLPGRLDIAYGAAPGERLDVFAPEGAADAPIQVFIHGGYWRALDKSDFSHLAAPLVAAGACAVMVGYDLCPTVTLDTIVREVRAAVRWAYENAASFGGDASRLFVSGHSAGAHLAAMAMAHDWAAEGLPGDVIKGVFAVSGVYALEPVTRISVNAEIGLDLDCARRNSPTLHPPGPVAPLVIAVGADEPAGWIAQSEDFYAACRARGVACRFMRVPGVHHFTIVDRLADGESALFRALADQMGLDRA